MAPSEDKTAETVSTDQTQYAPGDDVTLTGSGWTGDVEATIVASDSEDGTVVYETTATVSSEGTLEDTFTLPKKYIESLDVKVTGTDTDATATTSFSETPLDPVTITSDLADYAPASTVELLGTGWKGDETVRIIVNDTLGQTWQHDAIVPVFKDGSIADSFDLPDYFVATYDITAMGMDSGRMASATFTDSNGTITVHKAGRRLADGSVSGLNGVVFEAYAVTSSTTTTIPAGAPAATCTTAKVGGTDGVCSMGVPAGNTSARFLVVEQSPQIISGWTPLPRLSTGDAAIPESITTDYRFNVSVTAGSTVASGATQVPSSTRNWANAAANPEWPGFCGMNIALLFDESNSIDGTEWGQMKAAAQGFVTQLAGTPSNISIFSFASSAPGNSTKALTSVQATGTAAALNTYIGNMTQQGGGTNWDAGLRQIATTGQALDAVLVLTDGDPTYYVGGGDGHNVDLQNVEEAIHSANAVKAMPMSGTPSHGTPRVIGVGIGIGTGALSSSYLNLAAISGQTAGSDYYLTDFDALAKTLKDIATAQCGGKVTVQKRVGDNLESSTPADGWRFDATSTKGAVTPLSGFTANLNAPTGTDGSIQFTLTGTFPTDVTVTETPQTGYHFTSATCTIGSAPDMRTFTGANGAVVMTGVARTDSPSCVFLNSMDKGSLVLAKALKAGSEPFGGDFAIHYNCGTGFTGDVSVKAGASATVSGIPSNTSCTVSEPTKPSVSGYSWGTATFAPSATVSIPNSGTRSVTVTTTNNLTRNHGSLVLAKALKAGSEPFAGDFAIHYNCGTGFIGDVSVAAGESATVSGIPSNTPCTVSEPTKPSVSGYSWDTATFAPSATVSIPAADQASVTVTTTNNLTRNHGSLVLAKALKAGSEPFAGDFAIHYNCGTGFTGDVSVKAGASATVSGIPSNTSCTVSEPTKPSVSGYSWGTATFAPSATVTIPAADQASVTVTTTNNLTRDRGSLEISKTLANEDQATVPASFTVNYDCGLGYTGHVSVSPGSPATVGGIPTGSTCTVTEVAPEVIPGFTWGTITYTPASQVITAKGATYGIAVGNSITRDRGSLEISKTLANEDQATVPASYTVNYDCGLDYTGRVSVSPGSPATVGGIPTGSTCTVTEVAPEAIPNFTWGTITYTPASQVITAKGATYGIAVGNSITRDRGSLVIAKTLAAGGSGYSTPFAIDYSCALAGAKTLTGTVTVAAGSSKPVSGIPTGYVCTVTETLPGAPSGYTWSTPVISGSPATITKDTTDGDTTVVTTPTVTVANQLTAIPTPPPPPPNPPVTTETVTPLPAVIQPTTEPAVVVTPITPEPATVPETVPETVPVPEAATIPDSVPAGDGSQWPTQGLPLLAMVLLAAGGLGIAGARIRLRRADEE
ncbi:MAG: VWA domain-containing protein [Actinobacteria bacterium]|nr:VWA domain-containing protein [Actinomycetota bacterium]